MKIQPDTLKAMSDLMAPLDTDTVRARYRALDIPRADTVRDINKRYRWDLFYAARAYTVLPDGVFDSHIDTALKRIVPAL